MASTGSEDEVARRISWRKKTRAFSIGQEDMTAVKIESARALEIAPVFHGNATRHFVDYDEIFRCADSHASVDDLKPPRGCSDHRIVAGRLPEISSEAIGARHAVAAKAKAMVAYGRTVQAASHGNDTFAAVAANIGNRA